MTPVKAIRAKCLDCCCGQPGEVRLCPVKNCTLWPYRFGKRPSISNEEETVKKSIYLDFLNENSKNTAPEMADMRMEDINAEN